MYFNRKCKITFISHGATIYSEEKRFSDVEQYPPLSEEGQAEAENLCLFLKKRGIKNDGIYASGALRTVQTAKIIAKLYKQEFSVIEDLCPKKNGSFNGLTLDSIEKKYPNALYEIFNSPQKRVPEDAESICQFISRIKKTLNKIIRQNTGNRIIIVTHPDVIKAAICIALSIPAKSMNGFYIKTGSATQISYFENWNSLIYSDYKPE
ncbi:MAG: histidine phosphatase family protein [Heliobacteriaceae bacterium]|jgi:broad specificity phosphatase PhoE|nr:histidine phosphatase family protein [Heliobacteriaceae bacterium]